MAWTDSRIFQAWVVQPMLRQGTAPTGGTGDLVTADTVTAALFNNTTAPDRTVAVTSTGYNTGVWVTANEVTGASEWVAGGRNLASKSITPSAGVVTFTAANLAGSATVTMANIYGTLVYDNSITGGTVADQGVCFNYFGGAQAVTAGTFSVNWNASGIFSFTV